MSARVYWLERVVEAVVGNRLGAGVYRTWVESLGLRGHERVLEVGTGAGACARHLAAALPKGSLTCVDVDARWQAVARERLAGAEADVELVAADVAEYSRPGAFDAAVLHFVLHDIPEPSRAGALSVIAASLAPGGKLFVREPVEHGMSRSELVRLLAEAGFRQAGDLREERVPLMGKTVSGVWAA